MDDAAERRRQRADRARDRYQRLSNDDRAERLLRRRQRYAAAVCQQRLRELLPSAPRDEQVPNVTAVHLPYICTTTNSSARVMQVVPTAAPVPFLACTQPIDGASASHIASFLDNAAPSGSMSFSAAPVFATDYASTSSGAFTMDGALSGGATRSAFRNKMSDRYSRLHYIYDYVWELPPAPSCQFCHALCFHRETPSFCCCVGDVALAPIQSNAILQSLFLTDHTGVGVRFRRRVRTYNNNFALTSIGMKTNSRYCWSNQGIYTLKVNGQVSHRLAPFNPSIELPRRLQLFFVDTTSEIEADSLQKYDLDADILQLLLFALVDNPYFKIFKRLRQWETIDTFRVVLRADPAVDQRTHNVPTIQQVAGIWDESSDDPSDMNRDIKVYGFDSHSYPILYHLQYPLLFPYGQPGWHAGIQCNSSTRQRAAQCVGQNSVAPSTGQSAADVISNERHVHANSRQKRGTVSCREHAAYRCQVRPNQFNPILHSGRLGQQYSIDSYIKIETQRLDYYRMEQQQMDARTESLQGIVDSLGVDGETDPTKIGYRVVLPSSFIGGPRDMKKRYVNAMALVQNYGKPDLFITMTCNPNWIEIKNNLMPLEDAQDRSDLAARVFKSKLEEFKDEVVKKRLFGDVAAYLYVVEYQKRGLPHAHWIIILKEQYKLISPELYDQIICAELPTNEKSLLYNYVVSHMMHGPCGADNPKNVCMRDNKCKNNFPKEFCDVTTHGKFNYPNYRRRNDGRRVLVRNVYLDNRYVVPYCPYLLSKFNCHINVEACSDFKLVKYLYKYIYKGHDRISYNIVHESMANNVDEIKEFQQGRWISSVESYWRIFSFDITEMNPPVIMLPVHLPNQQYVCFGRKRPLNQVLSNAFVGKTMLTEFFTMNARDAYAKNLRLLYKDFPTHFVWEQKYRKWKIRQKGVVLGRVAVVDPSEGERYFLKLLLTTVYGPTSYEDLMTVRNDLMPTFRAAALQRGLLDSDLYAEQCLKEAAHFQMPAALRKLFAILLVHHSPPDPKKLFHDFFYVLSHDFSSDNQLPHSIIEKKTLSSIEDFLMCMGRSVHDFSLSSIYLPLNEEERFARDLAYELNIAVSASDLSSITSLNTKQKYAFNLITDRLHNDSGGGFFIDGPGGTGKTFLYRALLAFVRSKGGITLAVATSGVAASLLPGGRTAHSRFKFPVDIDEKSESTISKQSSFAKMILTARIIIWDEASMANRKIIEAFDRLLQDIIDQKNLLFGGKLVVFGGDFRQTLPIVPHGSKQQTLSASFLASDIWPQLIKIRLDENIRAKDDPDFTSFLLRVGDATEPFILDDNIHIPDAICIPFIDRDYSLAKLIDFVYPSIQSCHYEPYEFIS